MKKPRRINLKFFKLITLLDGTLTVRELSQKTHLKMSVIRSFYTRNKKTLDISFKSDRIKSERVKRKWLKFTEEEEFTIRKCIREKTPVKEIAIKLNRDYVSVREKYNRIKRGIKSGY